MNFYFGTLFLYLKLFIFLKATFQHLCVSTVRIVYLLMLVSMKIELMLLLFRSIFLKSFFSSKNPSYPLNSKLLIRYQWQKLKKIPSKLGQNWIRQQVVHVFTILLFYSVLHLYFCKCLKSKLSWIIILFFLVFLDECCILWVKLCNLDILKVFVKLKLHEYSQKRLSLLLKAPSTIFLKEF